MIATATFEITVYNRLVSQTTVMKLIMTGIVLRTE